jgi:hypothetical protein
MNTTPPACQPPPYPRRFGWPMRIFLTLFLAAATYRCFIILFPMRSWYRDYAVPKYPNRELSTLPELVELSGKATPDNPYPALDDLLMTADSVWDYWKPWPGKETRGDIKSAGDGAKVAACWLNGHLAFLEHLCAVDQGWPMFSPSVTTEHTHTRARLVYDDDSEQVVRQSGEPEDYRHYSHWFHDKRGNYQRAADDDNADACFGLCNLLAHRHGQNAAGAKLVKVLLFKVKVVYPAPGEDPQTHYARQNRLTADPPSRPWSHRSDPAHPAPLLAGAAAGPGAALAVRKNWELWSPQVMPDFYEFDVAARKGVLLKDEK